VLDCGNAVEVAKVSTRDYFSIGLQSQRANIAYIGIKNLIPGLKVASIVPSVFKRIIPGAARALYVEKLPPRMIFPSGLKRYCFSRPIERTCGE